MKKQGLFWFLGSLSFVFVVSGCVVRTYPLTKDRVDQDLTGNRGYIQGQAPSGEARERTTTRTTRVVEIELRSPLKFEKSPKPIARLPRATVVENEEQEEQIEGNRGYIASSVQPEIAESAAAEKYKVQKSDTLQKISQKYYGTTKKWQKIYDANRDVLKGPNSIYPGQVINIPVEGLRESKENLK